MTTIRMSLAFAVFAALIAPMAQASPPPLAVKTGVWETRIKTTQNGVLIPQSVLESMPAERRAQVLAAAKARAGAAHETVLKTCITAEDLAKGNGWGEDADTDEDCTRSTVSATASERHFKIVCTGDQPRTGNATFTALSPTQMKGVMDMTVPTGAAHIEINGRWLGPTCTGDED